MENLIPITEKDGNNVVSARELYKFLEVDTPFTMWTKRMFEYGFQEDKDFITFLLESTGGRPSTDYALTLDTAKEISMLQRSEKGKQARRYFIEAEKKLRSGAFVLPQTFAEALKLAAHQAERLELQQQELKKQAPKVEYHDEVLTSTSTYNTKHIAKELGMSAIALNRTLHTLGIQYKHRGTWLLYSKYQDKEYTKTETHSFTNSKGETQTNMQTVWTEKGREFIHELLKQQNVA